MGAETPPAIRAREGARAPGTEVPVGRGRWGRKAQITLNGPRRRGELRWGGKYHRRYRKKGCTSTGVVRPDTGTIGKEVRRDRGCKTRLPWRKRGGEEVNVTELASKFCPLASCPCRWPTRFTRYPFRVVANLTPVRNDQSTVESPNGTNYSAGGTRNRYYSTDVALHRTQSHKIKFGLSTTTPGTRVMFTEEVEHAVVAHRCQRGVIRTVLGNMMRYHITSPISPQHPPSQVAAPSTRHHTSRCSSHFVASYFR